MFFICNVPDLNPQVSFLLEYLHKSYLQHYSLYQYLLTTPQQMDYTQLVKEASCPQWVRGAGRGEGRSVLARGAGRADIHVVASRHIADQFWFWQLIFQIKLFLFENLLVNRQFCTPPQCVTQTRG